MNTPTANSPAISADALRIEAEAKPPILLQYWQILLRRRWMVLAIIAAALAAGLIVTFLQTPMFSAEARVEIRRAQDNVTDVEAVTPADADQDLEFYQTQYALLEARSLAARVVRQLDLTNSPEFFEAFDIELDEDDAPNRGAVSGSDAPLSREQLEERNRKAIATLLDNVGVSPIRGSALVDLQFTSPDPQLSKDIANAWVNQFIESNLDRRFSSSEEARDFLSERLELLRQRLEDSERQLVTYAANSGIVTLSSEQSADGRTRADRTLTIADIEALNTELAAAVADRFRAESRLRQGIGQESIQNATLGALRRDRAEISADVARLRAQFGEQYPPLVALVAKEESLNKAISTEEGRISQSMRTAFEQAAQRETKLRNRIDSLQGELVSEQRASIQYNIFQREVDTNRELYDGLLQRFKEIGVAGVGTNNVLVVDAAELPRSPSSPSLPLNLLVSLIGGLAIAGAVAFGLEHIDQSIKDPAQVRDLDLPLLGVIPAVDKAEILDELSDRKSMIGEAYLAAQANLSFLTETGVPKSIMLTSTRAAEGKSTSAYALAVMLARVGNRTVLIDADIRSPSLAKYAGVINERGLSNYLSGTEDLNSLKQSSDVEGLTLITTGPPPPNVAELLSSKRFAQLIETLSAQYDVILIDAPPVLGLADVPLISRWVDGVIYTIETNGVKMRGIQAALERLRIANANIFGAIVTKYDAKEQSGFGYGYAYGYGYGEKQ